MSNRFIGDVFDPFAFVCSSKKWALPSPHEVVFLARVSRKTPYNVPAHMERPCDVASVERAALGQDGPNGLHKQCTLIGVTLPRFDAHAFPIELATIW